MSAAAILPARAIPRVWDVFHILGGTAYLLGVNLLRCFLDRYSHTGHRSAPADLIRQRADQSAVVRRLSPGYCAGANKSPLVVITPHHIRL